MRPTTGYIQTAALIAILMAGPAHAESYKDQVQAAEALFEAGEYGEALHQVDLVLRSRATPDSFAQKALELRGRIQRKQEDWEGAVTTYKELIGRSDSRDLLLAQNPEEARRLLSAAEQAPPEPVLSYYYHLGQACRDGARGTTGAERGELVQDGQIALSVPLHFGYRRSFVQSALRELDELSAEPKAEPKALAPAARKRRPRWFATLGYVAWEERFEYTNGSGAASGLEFDAGVPCVGGGTAVRLGKFELGFKGCVAYGEGSVKAESSAVGYDHEGLRTYGVLVGPSVHWKPPSWGVSVGLHFPVVYRIAQLPVPNESGAIIGERNNFAFAFALELDSRIGPVSITQRVGVSPTHSAPLWSLALNWNFGSEADQ